MPRLDPPRHVRRPPGQRRRRRSPATRPVASPRVETVPPDHSYRTPVGRRVRRVCASGRSGLAVDNRARSDACARISPMDAGTHDFPPQAVRLAPKLRALADRGVYLGTSSWKYERKDMHCGSCPSQACACCRSLFVSTAHQFTMRLAAPSPSVARSRSLTLSRYRPPRVRPSRTCVLEANRRTGST